MASNGLGAHYPASTPYIEPIIDYESLGSAFAIWNDPEKFLYIDYFDDQLQAPNPESVAKGVLPDRWRPWMARSAFGTRAYMDVFTAGLAIHL
jgi:hypothetical protein